MLKSRVGTLALVALFHFAAAMLPGRMQASAFAGEPILWGWAELEGAFRRPGPTSGRMVKPGLSVSTPFLDSQPLPGFSAMIHVRDDVFIGMPDNGFGSKSNSVDFVLGFYEMEVDFARAGAAGSGPVHVRGFTPLSDPQRWLKNGKGIDLTVTADMLVYPGTTDPVDKAIQEGRWLTGFDFDVESMTPDGAGGYWIGEEFGPFLLHVDGNGALIAEPIEHPTLRSPSHPAVLSGREEATIAQSRGFEAIALGADARILYAVAEAAPTAHALRADPADERVIRLFELDTRTSQYTGRDRLYRKDGAAEKNAVVIGDMIHLAGSVFVLIERDTALGEKAEIKRVYTLDLDLVDKSGVLCKRLVLDLLKIPNPRGTGSSDPFSLPFDSIESLSLVDPLTLVIGVDSNYPSQATRHAGVADGAEIIAVRFAVPLAELAPRRSSDGVCVD